MVSRTLLALTAAVFAADSAQAAPSWRAAGGELFVGEAAPPAKSTGPADTDILPTPVQPYDPEIAAAATAHGIDPKLLHALVIVESAYRPNALSKAGAAGLAQLMPGTAQAFRVTDRFDPTTNLFAGAAYLARLLARFGDLRLALAAYNAGPERVAQLGRVPSIPETQAYVASVVDCYLALTAGRGALSAKQCRAPQVLP